MDLRCPLNGASCYPDIPGMLIGLPTVGIVCVNPRFHTAGLAGIIGDKSGIDISDIELYLERTRKIPTAGLDAIARRTIEVHK